MAFKNLFSLTLVKRIEAWTPKIIKNVINLVFPFYISFLFILTPKEKKTINFATKKELKKINKGKHFKEFVTGN